MAMESILRLDIKSMMQKGKINKLELIKIKNFYAVEVSMMRMKRLAPDWEKTFANYTFDKRLVVRMYQELSN